MKKQPYLTSFSVSFVTVTVSSFSITPISVTITITLFAWRTISVTISEKVQVVKWKACPVSARSRFTHRTIPLILVYTLEMKSHRTLFSSLNIDIYTFFKPASPFSVFTASVPISVSTSMWITIAFPIFITTAKLAIVVSRTLAALPAHGTRESLAESRGKPATHASVPRHAGRMSHHWVKSLGWICKVTMVTIANVLLII